MRVQVDCASGKEDHVFAELLCEDAPSTAIYVGALSFMRTLQAIMWARHCYFWGEKIMVL